MRTIGWSGSIHSRLCLQPVNETEPKIKYLQPAYFEIERIQLRSQEERQQEHHRAIVQEACRSCPLERCEVMGRELGEHALGFRADAAGLAEAAPFERLDFEVLACFHAYGVLDDDI